MHYTVEMRGGIVVICQGFVTRFVHMYRDLYIHTYLWSPCNDLPSVLVSYAYAWSPGPAYGLLCLPMWLPTCDPLCLYLAS